MSNLQLDDPVDINERQFKLAYSHFNLCCKSRKKKPQFLTVFLRKLFPNLPFDLVAAYATFLEHKRYQSMRKKAIIRSYIRKTIELKKGTEVSIYEVI